jgi:sulfate adenylyltransferase subunit 2
MTYQISHLDALESEAVTIVREVVAEFERPALLFSGGKDSAVLLHVAAKALRPKRLPFPVLHVDTGHNFPEVLEFRDRRVDELGVRLVVASVQDAIDRGELVEDRPGASRNRLQSHCLLAAVARHRFDALIGGARRDEDKARAKERVFSLRDEFGQWDPRSQRPELWGLYNTRHRPGEHLRVFPLSNWTELDVWQYVEREAIELPSLYFAHRRLVVRRDGMLFAAGTVPPEGWAPGPEEEEPFEATVRYRTIGDMTCTAAIESAASTVAEVIAETARTRVSERGATRADDRFSEAAMEDRKREGYF